ncbi:uncharacterized protein LOC126198905 [Schistocerca nitens]|uniref:uncharacterized protein LOC126198905 n=1 Tax=Schistocerca nitens TaxID=7011 RepID=UPI00211933A7|nr:uncharacterized protein LOC126198905 [Schistocerca nitens]
MASVSSAVLRFAAAVLLNACFIKGAVALLDQEFSPVVTASCKAGYMTIRVNTNQSFHGAIQARDTRQAPCIALGDGGHVTTLTVNLMATPGAPDYCGVIVNNKTEERKVPVAVRIHRTLELANDKFYVITCGKAGFRNANNQTSLVSLKLLDHDRKVTEVVYGRPYTLRADISRPDGMYGIRVRSCFAFSKQNANVSLIDDRGCPVSRQVISPLKYNQKEGWAEATIYSMFRFPDSTQVNLQCDIAVCKAGTCSEPACPDDLEPLARTVTKDIYTEAAPEDGVLMASTSVFVLDAGDAPQLESICDNSINPPWLLYLCIAFGIMFLIMLIINVFLCSAMTCSCARTEVIEKEPSIIEEYDPYRSWHGSQYGSRYSLNGGKQGYTSGGSTMNSTRSMSTNSDHYAIVHSRPGSRFSQKAATLSHPQHRGPPSHMDSHYSGKM